MPFIKILRLGLIHVAVALTLVPINSTLNRIMINELGLAATLVAVLVSLPYLFSPIQVWLGGYSDRHPLFGYRRTPYIALGLLLCVGGAVLAPTAAFMLADSGGPSVQSLLVGLVAFGAWGMGFNFATVSYLSLATDLVSTEEVKARSYARAAVELRPDLREKDVIKSFKAFAIFGDQALATVLIDDFELERAAAARMEEFGVETPWQVLVEIQQRTYEEQRPRTVGIMWFMLIVGVIVAAILIGRSLQPYSPAALYRAFYVTGAVALALGFGGLIGLERRDAPAHIGARYSFPSLLRMIGANEQARLFFVYLVVLLIALLGQDLLLEPFAGEIFGASVEETTRYTSIWGGALLVALLLAGPLTRRVGKTRAAAIGGMIAAAGLLLIALSGVLLLKAMLIPALVIFGFGSGLSTATNLALMLDMTLAGQVGAFIGAWGMADALARLFGTLLSGVLRDSVKALTQSAAVGYVTVFMLEALALGVSLFLLQRLNVARFREGATAPVTELVGYVDP